MRPVARWWKALSASPEVVEALQDRRTNFLPRLGGTNQHIRAAFERGMAGSYGWMYAHQPAVRSVVDYIARNVAQLGLKLYERVSDTERERREDHPAAETMANPDDSAPGDAFIFRLVADFLVYDNAYVLKLRTPGTRKLTLVRLPPAGVTVSGGRFRPDFYRVWRIDGSFFDVDPADILHWKGYNPEDPLLGLSKLETLREELAGDAVLQRTLTELAKGGLHSGHIERPMDAPEWSEPARQRFQESWRNQRTKPDVDGVLEEGMRYIKDTISPEDAELLASRRFTKEEVASLYGVPLEAMGAGSGGGAGTGVEDERKLVYSDVLPPIVTSLACQLDLSILRAEYGEMDFYFEFDLNSKLRGQPEQRFAAITAAVGRPWMLVEEARALENLKAIEGGDELTIPLNVALGSLPAPNVMPIQDPNKPLQDGSYREQPKALTNGHTKQLEVTTLPRREADMARQKRSIDKVKALLERHYSRQHRVIVGKSQAADSESWNEELAADLDALLKGIVELEAGITVSRLGGDDFDMRYVEHYLKAMGEETAKAINRVTQQDIAEVGAVAALNRARNERVPVASNNIGARVTLFAREEAALKSPNPELRRKTWIKDTERHKRLDGKSVPLGSDWGGISPGSEPNCACSALIS